MANVGANTATSMEEIATAMGKVAATANTVGVSMEQMSAIISTVSSVTRESAESIGTAYKTILARMGDLKLGETLEDGANLGAVSSQLEKIGVHILDANGELRDMGTIIETIMSKWELMSKAE
jgi:TP901 family phage tail tape measure protein